MQLPSAFPIRAFSRRVLSCLQQLRLLPRTRTIFPGTSTCVRSRSRVTWRCRGVINVLLLLTIVAVLYPLWFVVIASFSNPNAVAGGEVLLLPKGVTFAGYAKVFANQAHLAGLSQHHHLFGGRHRGQHGSDHSLRFRSIPSRVQAATRDHVPVHRDHVHRRRPDSELPAVQEPRHQQQHVGVYTAWRGFRIQRDRGPFLLRKPLSPKSSSTRPRSTG